MIFKENSPSLKIGKDNNKPTKILIQPSVYYIRVLRPLPLYIAVNDDGELQFDADMDVFPSIKYQFKFVPVNNGKSAAYTIQSVVNNNSLAIKNGTCEDETQLSLNELTLKNSNFSEQFEQYACNDSINKTLLGSTANPNYYYAREKINTKSNEEDTCVTLYSVSKKTSFFYTEIYGSKHSYEAKFILKSV